MFNDVFASHSSTMSQPLIQRLSALCLLLPAASGACPSKWGPDGCVFAPHMVLASNDTWSAGSTPARIWGTAGANELITVSGLPAGAVVAPSNPFRANASGFFSITISAAASLAPSDIAFKGESQAITLADVLFGHTILCSGQSNMDMPVYCSFTYNETFLVDAKKYPELRGMNQGANGNWQAFSNVAAPQASAFVEQFSATCFYAAFHLKENVPAMKSVPIGLVRSSVGGQVIERFMSPAALEAVGVPEANATGTSCGQQSHTLYDSLIAPLAPFVFKTLIW